LWQPALRRSEQKRLLAAHSRRNLRRLRLRAEWPGVGSDKYAYKLAWLDALTRWLDRELAANPRLVLAGDFNIAPEDRDVHDPAAWAGRSCAPNPSEPLSSACWTSA
jgi:exodeoxyribonuclease-3